MSDFTLLPANAATNGFLSRDCHEKSYNDHCAKDSCGDFARVHQDLGNLGRSINHENASASRSLHQSISDDTNMNLRGQAAIMKDICDNSRYVGDKVCDSTNSLKTDVYGSTRDVLGEVSRESEASRASVERQATETRSRVERSGYETRDEVEKFGFKSLDSVERLARENASYHSHAMLEAQKCCTDTQKIVLDKTCEIKEREAVHATEIKMLQENARIELLRQADTNRLILERQASDNQGQIRLQASENFCRLDKSVEMSKGEIKLQAMELSAKAELQSLKQHCDLQKQLADCCCELKELTREKHCETQLMFKNLEEQKLRDQLAQCQRESLEARINPFPYAQCVSVKNCCESNTPSGKN